MVPELFNWLVAMYHFMQQLFVTDSGKIGHNPRNNFRAHSVQICTSTRVSSTVKLYADDTKFYREIANIPDDTEMLQSDLFQLTEIYGLKPDS